MSNCKTCGKTGLQPDAIHTCTPLALRLADELEVIDGLFMQHKAAAEPRRLHELNEDLYQQGVGFIARIEKDEALLRQALEALEKVGTFDVEASSIWKHFYPSATGDYVNLREFRDKAAPTIAAIRKHLENKS